MRIFWLLSTLCATCLPMQTSYAALSLDGVGQDVLVKFKANVQPLRQSQHRLNMRVSRMKSFKAIGGIEHWTFETPMDARQVIEQLKNDPDIEYIEPNYRRYFRRVPNDPGFSMQWGLNNTGQLAGAVAGVDMQVPLAWDINTGSKNVVVAVIDDSIDIFHEDLYANIWTNPGEIPNNGQDDDNNNYIDDVHGWDFVDNDNDPSANPGTLEGHGTHVAGNIGAMGDNGLGVTGVNWNVSIMPLKFLGDVASQLGALDYAIANGATIVNASWGGSQFSFAESAGMKKLLDAGILLVAAAGNWEGNNDRVPDYPSGLPYANILAVSALDMNGSLTPWSHFGSTHVDVAAPGVDVYTTSSNVTSTKSYKYATGTSFSSPLTAGVAALISAQYPTATYQEIKGRIMASATPMAQHALSATDGMVNANQALTIAPRAELVVSDVLISDNNNHMLDPNEHVQLSMKLENVWQAATGITASLSTTDNLVTITQASASWPDLATGIQATSLSTFNLTLGNFSGYRVVPFTLNITTLEGATFTRYFELTSGSLQHDVVYDENTMQHDQDEFQYFHVDVPQGAKVLNVTLDSNSFSTDVDLLLRFDAEPQFDYGLLFSAGPQYGTDASTYASLNNGSDEQLLINNPKAGTWHVVVVSYDQMPGTYKILASITSTARLAPTRGSQGSSGGGGMCLNSTWVYSPSNFVLLLMLALFVRRSTYCKGEQCYFGAK